MDFEIENEIHTDVLVTSNKYNDMYLKMDVYILADCFESFIKKLN